MQTKIPLFKPSEILSARQRLADEHDCGLFLCAFGCTETEVVAETVIRWLSSNGDDWSIPVPVESISSEYHRDHSHSCGFPEWEPDVCHFRNDYLNDDGSVNKHYIEKVCNPFTKRH